MQKGVSKQQLEYTKTNVFIAFVFSRKYYLGNDRIRTSDLCCQRQAGVQTNISKQQLAVDTSFVYRY